MFQMFLLLALSTVTVNTGWWGTMSVWRGLVMNPAARQQRTNGRVDAAPIEYG